MSLVINPEQYIQIHGPLFEAVQKSGIFPDSKTFVDSVPKNSPADIRERYKEQKDDPDFDLKAFVLEHFEVPGEQEEADIPEFDNMNDHIDHLWDVLSRSADEDVSEHSTLIPLPHPYIVPGGRFREIYYWDTYFTSLGLAESGHLDTVRNLTRNFAYQIEQFGHVPNGNRVYYLSRSQPPFMVFLVDLLSQHDHPKAYEEFLPALKKEYEFWTAKRSVVFEDDVRMFRYWDENPVPREESYKEDYELQEGLEKEESVALMRNIRAACESGWDFSSRWFRKSDDLATIRTTQLLPVDLNALMYFLEKKLGEWTQQQKYIEAARNRKATFDSFFWDDSNDYYFDYDFRKQSVTDEWTAAGAYPLFVKLATPHQAKKTAAHLEEKFLRDGGIVTTLKETGQQWDAPNGWAPLQWVCVQGLLNYGYNDLAKEIATRWVNLNNSVFGRTGKMMEKYNVEEINLHAGGGEYPLQDGFGWSNGVVAAMKKRFGI